MKMQRIILKDTSLLCLFFLGFTFSCTQSTKSNVKNKTLIETIESTAGNAAIDSLLELEKLALSNIEEGKNDYSARLYYQLGLLFDRSKSFSKASYYLKNAILSTTDPDIKQSSLLALANIKQYKLKDRNTSSFVANELLQLNPKHNKVDELKKMISPDAIGIEYVKTLNDQSLGKGDEGNSATVNREIAQRFIESIQIYHGLHPNSDVQLPLLDNAADYARSISANRDLLDILNIQIYDFPQSEQAQQALFLKAFHMETVEENKEEAKKLYRKFIDEYPENIFVKDAKFLLENIDKTEEEILQEFEKMARSKNK